MSFSRTRSRVGPDPTFLDVTNNYNFCPTNIGYTQYNLIEYYDPLKRYVNNYN